MALDSITGDHLRTGPTRIHGCKGLVVAVILALLFPVEGRAQSHSAFPVDIVAGPAPHSDAPHLHFQLMDANSPLGAEGLPYEIDRFTQLGVIGDPAAVQDSGHVWKAQSQVAPVVHRRELPVDNAVVVFP